MNVKNDDERRATGPETTGASVGIDDMEWHMKVITKAFAACRREGSSVFTKQPVRGVLKADASYFMCDILSPRYARVAQSDEGAAQLPVSSLNAHGDADEHDLQDQCNGSIHVQGRIGLNPTQEKRISTRVHRGEQARREGEHIYGLGVTRGEGSREPGDGSPNGHDVV